VSSIESVLTKAEDCCVEELTVVDELPAVEELDVEELVEVDVDETDEESGVE
jgi:hypothetical protein